jgi:hypothetical protein
MASPDAIKSAFPFRLVLGWSASAYGVKKAPDASTPGLLIVSPASFYLELARLGGPDCCGFATIPARRPWPLGLHDQLGVPGHRRRGRESFADGGRIERESASGVAAQPMVVSPPHDQPRRRALAISAPAPAARHSLSCRRLYSRSFAARLQAPQPAAISDAVQVQSAVESAWKTLSPADIETG